jgi:hypothetical protein
MRVLKHIRLLHNKRHTFLIANHQNNFPDKIDIKPTRACDNGFDADKINLPYDRMITTNSIDT